MTKQNIQQQKPFRILLIGDDCLDEYQYGVVERLSPEAPVPVFKFQRKDQKPGMAANVYQNLMNLGCKVNRIFGNQSKKTRLIDLKSKQHIVRIDEDLISKPLVIEPDLLQDYDAIVVSDYNKGTVSYETLENLQNVFSGPIFVDTKKTELDRMNKCIVKINTPEFMASKSKCEELIVTAGEQGAYYKGTRYPAMPVEVADVCGAGDTFLAALTYKYLQTNSIEQSIPFAIRAASITVQHLGVYAPDLGEINAS